MGKKQLAAIARGLELTEAATRQGQEQLKTMERLQRAMDAINESNRFLDELRASFQAIQHKTRVIHDIVFKTQLLSFNASIEAARAGQFGKGFSVVAEEVGRLAKTSGRAAQEIEALLSDSQMKATSVLEKVTKCASEGVSATREVKSRFGILVDSIAEISSVLDEANRALHEEIQVIAPPPQRSLPTTWAQEVASHKSDKGPLAEDIDANHHSFKPQR